jgi:allophanate hydrolase
MAEDIQRLTFNIDALRDAYAARKWSVVQVVEESLRRIAAGAGGVWISMVPRDVLLDRARQLDHLTASGAGSVADLPLFGIPYAVKDNIDVAALETTAACPAFAYRPRRNAPVIDLLENAGAICIGKTNMDQFATGLVGVRSAYGECPNALQREYISGGSSSGSAVAVALGQVSFALGTDTAGSGRVPAAMNNIIGFKPTRGLLSTRGVVPACRSLDCVSVFSLLAADAWRVFQTLRKPDGEDEFSIPDPPALRHPPALPPVFNLGVPRPGQLQFFGDHESESQFQKAVGRMARLGGNIVEIDFSSFQEAGELLYNGPWIVERYAGLKPFVSSHPDECLPVIEQIFSTSSSYTAQDVFAALHRRRTLLMESRKIWRNIHAIMLPTTPTIYTRSQINADPIRLNTNLGYYTRFANLLDCCAISVPAAMRAGGLPFGMSLVGKAYDDHVITALAIRFHADTQLTMGASASPMPGQWAFAAPVEKHSIDIAVVGAHLSGQPLNYQLTSLEAQFVREARTAPCYQLSLLANAKPVKPGLLRVSSGGGAIKLEIWRMPRHRFGEFIALVPQPLSIGSITLEDSSIVKGFLCESIAAQEARDVTSYGGWREFLIEDR